MKQIESGTAWSKVPTAGTGMCVHIPFRLNPIASLARLGKQLPCPLLLQNQELLELLEAECDTHTHTEPLSGALKNDSSLFWSVQRSFAVRCCVSFLDIEVDKLFSYCMIRE